MASRGLSSYNAGMRIQRERLVALGLSVGAALLTIIPYLLANCVAAPHIFSGFLINPLDGFSYLAKMREGAAGSWTFTLPYAAEPGPGVHLYLYYLFLGQLAAIFHLPLILTFHLARVGATVLMFYLAYLFYERVLEARGWAWCAYLLTLFSGGLGWLGLLVGIEGSDLAIPESIPLVAAYTNAHFPLAAAAILAVALTCMGLYHNRWLELLNGWLAGTVLMLVLPFSLLSIGTALLLWLGFESMQRRNRLRSLLSIFELPGMVGALGFGLGVLPWLAYSLLLVRNHPVIAVWTAQNQTPSPGVASYLIGFGPLVLAALVGVARGYPFSRRNTRFAVIWLLSNALLLYAPFPLQRRLSLGLYFPLAALAVLGMAAVFKPARLRIAVLAVIILSLPSSILLAGAGIYGVQCGEPEVVYDVDELDAYRWMESGIPAGSLVLAAPLNGNRLPAFATVRVLYGHPFETPDAEVMEALVGELMRGEGLERLDELGVEYIYADGDHFNGLSRDGGLEVSYANESVTIYRIIHDE